MNFLNFGGEQKRLVGLRRAGAAGKKSHWLYPLRLIGWYSEAITDLLLCLVLTFAIYAIFLPCANFPCPALRRANFALRGCMKLARRAGGPMRSSRNLFVSSKSKESRFQSVAKAPWKRGSCGISASQNLGRRLAKKFNDTHLRIASLE